MTRSFGPTTPLNASGAENTKVAIDWVFLGGEIIATGGYIQAFLREVPTYPWIVLVIAFAAALFVFEATLYVLTLKNK